MATQEYKIKVEYGVSAIVLLIGAFFIFQAFTIETSREAVGPRTMPLYLAVALVLGGLWLAIRAFTGRAGNLKEGYGFLESDVKRIVMVVGCGVLFVLLFWALGYFAAVIASYIAMLYTFGVRRWGWIRVLKAPHPSPLSAHRGFIGCGHFSAANEYLQRNGQTPIDWALPPRSAL